MIFLTLVIQFQLGVAKAAIDHQVKVTGTTVAPGFCRPLSGKRREFVHNLDDYVERIIILILVKLWLLNIHTTVFFGYRD